MLNELTGRFGGLSHTKRTLLAVLALLLLSSLFFANVLFTDKVLVSDNLDRHYPWKHYAADESQRTPVNDIWDRVLEEYPQRLIAARIVRGGELPLWNPYYLSGMPLLATDPGRGFFYPFNIIFYLIDPVRALGYASLLQLFLATAFTYFYLRTIGLRGLSPLFGAIVFGLGGYFLSYLSWLDRVNTGIWIPLMFLCVEKLYRGGRWIWSIALGFAIGMATLAGHFGVVAYELLALGLYSGWRLFSALRNRGTGRATQLALFLTVGLMLGTSLGAVQLAPTYDALRFVERAHRSYEARLGSGRAVHVLAMALVPDVFGNPVDPSPWGRHRFGDNIPGYYAPSSTYAGVLPLTLAVWVLAVKRSRFAAFFAFLAALSVSIFLDTLVFRLLYFFPIFRYGRQVEAKIIYMFAMSVLAALGLSSLFDSTAEVGHRLVRWSSFALSIIAVLLVIGVGLGGIFVSSLGVDNLGLAGEWYEYNIGNFLRFAILVFACSILLFVRSIHTIKPHLLSIAAIVLVVGDLFYYGWRFNPPQDPGDLYPVTEGIAFLQGDRDIFRIFRGPGGKHTLPPNTPAVYDLSEAGGYRALLLEYYREFMNLVEEDLFDVDSPRTIRSLRQAPSVSSRLLDLLNVKYILSRPEGREDLTGFAQSDENTALVYQGDMKIYENKNVLPRAFVVTDYKVLYSKEEIFAELANVRFDPATCVILDQEPRDISVAATPASANSSAHVLDYTANRVTVEAETSRDGLLVLSDLYYSGWKVLVDGEEETLYRAYYVFRAVQLREGRHVVEFVFDPLPFKVGLGVSAITLVLCLSLSTYYLLRKHPATAD